MQNSTITAYPILNFSLTQLILTIRRQIRPHLEVIITSSGICVQEISIASEISLAVQEICHYTGLTSKLGRFAKNSG